MLKKEFDKLDYGYHSVKDMILIGAQDVMGMIKIGFSYELFRIFKGSAGNLLLDVKIGKNNYELFKPERFTDTDDKEISYKSLTLKK